MSYILPVITLYQPWATWIMRGWKTIETRTHPRFACLSKRTILIHAGMTTDDSSATVNNPYLTREQIMYKPEEVINGYILGGSFVEGFMKLTGAHSKDALIDCENTERFGLFLDAIDVFKEPILEKGEVGIWYYDLDKREKVKKSDSQIKIFT